MMAGPSQQNTKQLLDDIATCSMCLDLFEKPKSLPCLHTFCLDCLRGFTNSRPGTSMKCPLCRKDFQIPAGGFEALPSNFLIEQLLQVNAGEVSTSGGYKVDAHVDGAKLQSVSGKAQQTGSATTNAPQSCSDADRKQLRECNVKLDLCLKNNAEELKQLDADKVKLLKEISASEEALTKRSNELKQLLDLKHKTLLEELEGIKNRRLNEIACRRNDVEEKSAVLVSFQQYSKQIESEGAWGEMRHSSGDLRANAVELVQSAERFNKSRLREVSVSFSVLQPTSDICIGKICLIAAQQPTTDHTDAGRSSTPTSTSNALSSPSLRPAVTTSSNSCSPAQPAVTTSSDSHSPAQPAAVTTSSNSHSPVQPAVTANNNSHPPPRPAVTMSNNKNTPSQPAVTTITSCNNNHSPNQSQSPSTRRCQNKPRRSSNHATVSTLFGNLAQHCATNNHPFNLIMHSAPTVFSQLNPGGTLHPGVTCDGCRGEVRGCRYKCQVCPDFDLCETCNAMNRHSQHAMTQIDTPPFPPYPFHTVQPSVPSVGSNDTVHFGVTCDCCRGQVRGTRYKCVVCPDFDLCESCNAIGVHSHHGMQSIDVPRSTSFLGGVLHPGIRCDECNGEVRGNRFKCKVCPNFDLCEGCKWADMHSHHGMITIQTPRNRNHFQ